MWTPTPLLRPVQAALDEIDETFLVARQRALELLGEVEVHHVGSTALAPALCRGIVDIEVLVDPEDLSEAARTLAQAESLKELALPVEMSVGDRDKPSSALHIRDVLVQHPLKLGEFVGLQKRFAHVVGKPYPRAKAAFFLDLLDECPAGTRAPCVTEPYRIELATPRLRLQSPLALDAESFASYLRDNRGRLLPREDDYYEAATWRKHFALEAMQHWQRQALTLLFRSHDDDAVLGACNFHGFAWDKYRSCSLGYHLSGDHEGQGLATEGVQAAIRYLFEQWGVHRICAAYDAQNTRSARLLERLDFRVEGTARDYLQVDGRWLDSVIVARIHDSREPQVTAHRRSQKR